MPKTRSTRQRILTAAWPGRWWARFGLLLALYLVVFALFVLPLGYLGFLGGEFPLELPLIVSVAAAAVHASFVKPGRNLWSNAEPVFDDPEDA